MPSGRLAEWNRALAADGNCVLWLAYGDEVTGCCVIVATGVRARRLPGPGLGLFEEHLRLLGAHGRC
jgi:hypothetical protein